MSEKRGRVTDNQGLQEPCYPPWVEDIIDQLTEPDNLLTLNKLLEKCNLSEEQIKQVRMYAKEDTFWEVINLTNRKKIKRFSYLANNSLVDTIINSSNQREKNTAINLFLRLTGEITERANIFSPTDYAIALSKVNSNTVITRDNIRNALKRSETELLKRDKELELE